MPKAASHLLPRLIVILVALSAVVGGRTVWIRTPWGQTSYWLAVLRQSDEHEGMEAQAELLRLHRDRPDFFAAVLADSNPHARYFAVDALGEIDPPNLTNHLERALKDYDSQVRLRAVELIGQRRDPNHLPLLRRLLHDSDEIIREEAVSAIAKLRSQQAIGSLLYALDDNDGDVVGNAAFGLRHLAGKDFGFRFRYPEAEKRRALEAIRIWAHRRGYQAEKPGATLLETTRAEAPDFRVENLRAPQSSRLLSLRDLRGNVVIVNFWAVWCPPCIPELEDLARLEEEYSQSVRVVALSIDDGVHRASKAGKPLRTFLREHPWLPSVIGLADTSVMDAYGHIHGVPVSVVIDHTGRIYRRYSGVRSSNVFEKDVQRLIQEGDRS